MTKESKYSREIQACLSAFDVEHRLYNDDTYFIKFFKFPENHPIRIRNTDIKQIGKLYDKGISAKVINSLISRYGGPDLSVNIIRTHVFGNIDIFHRFFYETLLDSDAFNELVRVTTKLGFHVTDKDEENLIDQANNLRERFYQYAKSQFKLTGKNSRGKHDKLQKGQQQQPVQTNNIIMSYPGIIDATQPQQQTMQYGAPIQAQYGIQINQQGMHGIPQMSTYIPQNQYNDDHQDNPNDVHNHMNEQPKYDTYF